MREKRESNRVSYRVPVRVVSNNTSFEAKSKDISLGGMLLSAYSLPPLGSKVELHFNIGSMSVKLDAFVRWSTNSGFGVQFDLMGVKETHEINKLISQSAS